MATHIFTSIAANYLPKARVLAHSLKKFHPAFNFHIILCDVVPSWFDLKEEPFDSVITIQDLPIKNPEQWIFKHSIVELSTAVKGFALNLLLQLPDSENVFYFDPDMVIMQPLTGLIDELRFSSILLTPHIAEPEETVEAILDNEFSVLQHGIYNLGFVGVRNSPEGCRFAQWWQDRLHQFCYDDIPRGIFTDQRWADLAPAYFPDCKILRDPVYNVCTWNLTHRTVTGSLQDGFLANGQPIVFYHFSGFDSGAQKAMLDKYGHSMPALHELRDWYIAECERLGQDELSLIPWAYGFYDNGERIAGSQRRLYRDRGDLQKAFPNPFATSSINTSYLHWLSAAGEVSVGNWRETPRDDDAIPEYRIAVLAMATDIHLLADTLANVRASSVRSSDITVFIGTDHSLSVVAFAGGTPVFVSCANYQDLFAKVISNLKEKDILLVRAGLKTPVKWDLRLAWTACRQGAIGAVSPLSSKLLAPSDINSGSISLSQLDSYCVGAARAGEYEAGQFWSECVYVRAEALQQISALSAQFTPTYLLNSFARARFPSVLATHVCVTDERPDSPDSLLRSMGLASVIDGMRSDIQTQVLICRRPPNVAKRMTKATLCIMHSWGGGLERWVSDYCAHDNEHEHYILKSFGTWSAFGSELRLFDAANGSEPLETWPLSPPIKATSGGDSRYSSILSEIRKKYEVGRIIVSSFIGHSLEAIRQPIPTIVVCHDYYPFCPALYITFNTLCKSCDAGCLTKCGEQNPLNHLFRNVPTVTWLQLRRELIEAVQSQRVNVVGPSLSVQRHYRDLAPALAAQMTVIEHGSQPSPPLELRFEQGRRLRVLVLGKLSVHKGGPLFESILPALVRFADVLLMGCGEGGAPYQNRQNITVVPEYELKELPSLLAAHQPDLALLLSQVPETFSYTLQELRELAVPSLAVRLGSFVDRIEDNVTGFLCDPEPALLLQKIKALGENRLVLMRVHNNLKSLPQRSVEEMVKDYDRLSPAPFSAAKYFRLLNQTAKEQGRDLQLYWRTRQHHFNELNSVTAISTGTDRQALFLNIPPQNEELQELRLDFFSKPSLLLLYELTVRDRAGSLIWGWQHSPELFASKKNQLLVLDEKHSDGALLWISGGDGYIILPLMPAHLAALRNGGHVEVSFAVPSAASEVAWLAERVTDIDTSHPEIARLSQEVTRLSAMVDGMLNSLSWRITKPARSLMERGRR